MPEPSNILLASLKRILEDRASLTRAEARLALEYILDVDDFGAELRTSALLGALAARGETGEELAGFVDVLRARAVGIPLSEDERSRLVDTCGTGGDLSGTFNISTAAGLVAAAAGVWIAKHGNRAVTSRCGSADVLEALGIPVDLTPDQAAEALRQHGFAFLAAPSLQPAMKAVMPLRRAIGVRTAFNILGPMTNPAGARAQVLGVYAERLIPVVAGTLAKLETRHAFVVHGTGSAAGGAAAASGGSAGAASGGIDEFSISGPTAVGEVRDGEVWYSTLLPGDLGLRQAPIETLAGGDAETNAAILRSIFAGETGPRRDIVLMNAAAVLVTAGLATRLVDGVRLAEETIDQGRVTKLVAQLAAGGRSG